MIKNKIVLLHGALGAASTFKAIETQLSQNFEVFTYDFPSHGTRAGEQGNFKMMDLVEDFKSWLSETFNEPVWVFGFSMGGYVALSLAQEQPKVFKGIMTLGTKFNWTPEGAEQETKMLVPEKIEAKVPQFATYLKSLHGENWKVLCEKTQGMMIDLGNNPLLSPANVTDLQLKVRIAMGDQDNMVSFKESIEMYNALPNASFQVIPDCKHPIEKVDAKRLAQEINSFVKG